MSPKGQATKSYRALASDKPQEINKKQKLGGSQSVSHKMTRKRGYDDLTLQQASLLGKRISKYFGDNHNAWFDGTVVGFRFKRKKVLFDIHYDDGDEEELNQEKTRAAIVEYSSVRSIKKAPASKDDESDPENNSYSISIESDSVGAMREHQRTAELLDEEEDDDKLETDQEKSGVSRDESNSIKVVVELDASAVDSLQLDAKVDDKLQPEGEEDDDSNLDKKSVGKDNDSIQKDRSSLDPDGPIGDSDACKYGEEGKDSSDSILEAEVVGSRDDDGEEVDDDSDYRPDEATRKRPTRETKEKKSMGRPLTTYFETKPSPTKPHKEKPKEPPDVVATPEKKERKLTQYFPVTPSPTKLWIRGHGTQGT